jgi:alanine transaminase
LTRDNLRAVLQFCVDHQLVVLADEVYQENVYDDNFEFVSCKRMAYEMGLLAAPSNRDSDKSDKGRIELVSFHSTSKGVFGECGRRGGYMELVGIDPAVKDMIYKLASSTLCSTVSGQIMTSLMCRGPAPGDPSYASHEAEKHAIWSSLKRKAQLVSQGLNAIPGFACQPATGSMYCFPSVQMPPGVLAEAAAQGTTPDTLYALDLLESTGICVVPASGFGQEEGRYGFRTTFLPSEEDLKIAVQKFAEHYQRFCEKYN